LKVGLIAALLACLGLLSGCALGLAGPDPVDDDDVTFPSDDDDAQPDDDDVQPDDDDVGPDDDDVQPDDDDVQPDDDDVGPDDDDIATDDDDIQPDDDDVAPDDDDATPPPDDDDATPPPDDDDATPPLDDDDATPPLDDDDTTPPPDDDDATPPLDDDDATLPGCSDDGYEDNDAEGAAASVSTSLIADLVACDGDEDWYTVPVDIAEMVSVDVFFTDSEGDVDLQLYDPTGTFLTGSQTVDDDESVGPVQAQQGGDYLVRVWLWSDSGSVPGNEYDLLVTVDPPVCVDDGWEDNDTTSTPASFSPGSRTGLQVCASDDDYWAVALSAGQTMSVDLTFSDAEGDVDLRIKDGGGATLASSLSVDDDESIPSFTASATGDYMVQATLWSDAGSFPGNSYDLDVGLPGCQDDEREPNDTSLSATTTYSYSFADYGLSLCTGDVDWFERDLAAGETIEVDVFFADAAGDLDLEFYVPPSAAWETGSYSGSDDEALTYTATTSGTHFFRLYLFSDDGDVGQGYDLLVDSY
jgi:hypothetical protein